MKIITHEPESHRCKPVDEWLSVQGSALPNPENKGASAVLRQAQDGSKDGERSRTIKPWGSTLFICTFIFLTLGCARVRVEAPKEPIKVDISMRLDIYQHVEKDIDEIEKIVSGTKKKPESRLNYFVRDAYAQDSLSPEVEQAAMSRKNRRPELISLEEKGIVGENRSGMVEIRAPESANPSIQDLVKLENNDRMVIYKAIADKNEISIEEVQSLYARRLQEDAVAGTPIESLNEATGAYEWRIR